MMNREKKAKQGNEKHTYKLYKNGDAVHTRPNTQQTDDLNIQ